MSTSISSKKQYKDDLFLLSSKEYAYMAYYFTNKLRQEIGKNIQKIRRDKGLGQVEVAVAAGINLSYYGKIERGLVNPSIEKVYGIIRALNVHSSKILPF